METLYQANSQGVRHNIMKELQKLLKDLQS